ncbi:LysE family translocator [Streptomyces sp. NPDC002172]
MPVHLPLFVLTTWLLAMLPGAGQALMIRQILAFGPRPARATIAGNATGLLVWSTAAAVGLSAVLLANPHAYLVVRVAGGAVLFALGLGTLRAAAKEAPRRSVRTAGAPVPAGSGARTVPAWAPRWAIPRPGCSPCRCCPSSSRPTVPSC